MWTDPQHIINGELLNDRCVRHDGVGTNNKQCEGPDDSISAVTQWAEAKTR